MSITPPRDEEMPDTPTSWQMDLPTILDIVREMSEQTDPQEMVKRYAARIRPLFPSDGMVSVSRRGLEYPKYRITRSSKFTSDIDPWREPHRLPLLEGGLLCEWLYGGVPVLNNNCTPSPDDPAFEHIGHMRSFSAIPHFDGGQALNMVVQMASRPNGFHEDRFPFVVFMSNLFGRATNTLVLSRKLREALDALDRELKVVSTIQRSLLPRDLPEIAGVEIAADYATSKWAGGDYYDFFDLRDGRYGLLIADVSGHGTPAAVLMAIMHAIAHQFPGPAHPPGQLLAHINRELCRHYTNDPVMFVTAFYGIFDPVARTLTYANAGHPSPVVRNFRSGASGAISSVDSSIPLGITPDVSFVDSVHTLTSGDILALYTDGITEAREPEGPLFGEERLLLSMGCACGTAQDVLRHVLKDVDTFTRGAELNDDRTMLVLRLE
jgi:sigma-B regulation protein RsbU (phosphoserine phosphatase)